MPGEDGATAAARWHARLTSEHPSEGTRAAFARWRSLHPDNPAHYAAVEAAFRQSQAAADAPGILALRQETLTRVVVGRRRRIWPATAAAAVAVLVAAGAWLELGPASTSSSQAPVQVARAPNFYETRVGERLTVTLADGSTATLNTASRMRALYSTTERRIVLEKGQALFEVAKGQSRPFTVVAGGQAITAHGTAFDVRLDKAAVKVSLLEGRVSVQSMQTASTRAIDLRPKDVLVVASNGTSVKRVENVEQLTSWRDGLLIFDDASLGEAVAEINRYVDQKVVLDDAAVAELRVSGAFRTGDTTAFIEALELSFPLAVKTRAPDRIVLASR